jgi:hypothetical protein
VPGEHLAGTIYDPASGVDLEVWHFQDDAVSGDVTINPFITWNDDYPESPYVEQGQSYPDEWRDENYILVSPLCTGTGYVDGPGPSAEHPEGIADFSKDLAFALYTKEQKDCMQEAGIDVSDPAEYAEFVEAGKPTCWCYPTQCEGDTDGKTEGGIALGYFHVGAIDIGVLAGAWMVTEPTKGPGITTVNVGGIPGACANFDHAKEGGIALGYFHVGAIDIGILAGNWMVTEPTKGPGIAKTCVPGNRTAP